MIISTIVAMSKNCVIGVNNELPWRLPADLKYFKSITMGKPIVMGRKTFESIGKPLPGRDNIILTRDQDFKAEGCCIVHDVKETLELCKDRDEIMIIGGAQIFEQFLPMTDRLYVTYVEVELEGDVFFPFFELTEWRETNRMLYPADEKNKYSCVFCTLERIRP